MKVVILLLVIAFAMWVSDATKTESVSQKDQQDACVEEDLHAILMGYARNLHRFARKYAYLERCVKMEDVFLYFRVRLRNLELYKY